MVKNTDLVKMEKQENESFQICSGIVATLFSAFTPTIKQSEEFAHCDFRFSAYTSTGKAVKYMVEIKHPTHTFQDYQHSKQLCWPLLKRKYNYLLQDRKSDEKMILMVLCNNDFNILDLSNVDNEYLKEYSTKWLLKDTQYNVKEEKRQYYDVYLFNNEKFCKKHGYYRVK